MSEHHQERPDEDVTDEEVRTAEGEHLRSLAALCGVAVTWPPEPDDALRAKVQAKRAPSGGAS